MVAGPDGSQVQVIVPAGMFGGQVIAVEMPAAAPPPQLMMMAQPAMMQPMGMPQTTIPMGVPITPVMMQQALSLGVQDQVPLLDDLTMGILAATSSFQVKQRVKFWETLSGGCCEQSNTYDFFDQKTGAHVFIAQEYSDDCTRCICNPYHSLRVEFKLVNAADRSWSSRTEIASMPTVMHFEREGWCSKPCLACCIPGDTAMCKDGFFLHAGPALHGEPGLPGVRDGTIAYASQPKWGGCFTPTMNIFTRSSPGKDETSFAPMAKLEGPQFFGGCLELLCNSEFKFSGFTPQTIDTAVQTGDVARMTKVKPRGFCSCVREMYTDSDHYTIDYREGIGLTPNQKASMMASMVLADYMFFEQDHGPCDWDGRRLRITLCETYCCGAIVPITIRLENQNGGGGAPPSGQAMER